MKFSNNELQGIFYFSWLNLQKFIEKIILSLPFLLKKENFTQTSIWTHIKISKKLILVQAIHIY